MKSAFPAKFSWDVRRIFTPRSTRSWAGPRRIVAPICDLMSSPTMGSFASVNFRTYASSLEMNSGMQLMNPHPASRAQSA